MSYEPTQTTQSVEEINELIATLEKRIAEEPLRLKEEQERKRTTMPASDIILELQDEKRHELNKRSRSEVENIRITQGRDYVLLILFILGIVAMCLWINHEIPR